MMMVELNGLLTQLAAGGPWAIYPPALTAAMERAHVGHAVAAASVLDVRAGPIATHHTDTVDTPWDGPANEARISNDAKGLTLRKFYAWVDSNADPDVKASYKFGHHEVAGDGTIGAANLRACSSGIGVLNGARGGSNIPDSDREGVHRHLAAHMMDGNMEPAPLAAAEPMLLHTASSSAAAAAANGSPPARTIKGSVAVIPIQGVLTQKGPQDFFDMLFGGVSSMERIGATIDKYAADRSVGAIILDINSPGGSVMGTPELAATVRAARRRGRPIVALANSLAASAAYWIASQADEIVVAPSAQVGSIGVISMHEDITALAEQMGVKVTLITAGKYKALGSEFEPLTPETTALVQASVDGIYADFVAAVAAGRGTTQAAVKSGFGQGWIVGAEDAVAGGMADRVGTLRDVLAGFGVAVPAGVDGGGDGSAAAAAANAHAHGQLELERERLALRR